MELILILFADFVSNQLHRKG